MTNGLLLALQFFSILPIHKEIPMTKKTVTAMFVVFPWLGALIGFVLSIVYYLLHTYTDISPLLLSFILISGYVICSGGLHLDGYVDTSDAYFSYRDKKKRLEILDDPRTGAFGAISLVFLILAKIFFLAELLEKPSFHWIWLIAVPFLSRLCMSIYFICTRTSKEKGLAHFFKQHLHMKYWLFGTVYSMIVGGALFIWLSGTWAILFLLFMIVLAALIYRWWSLQQFSGSSGDLLGALIEGMEAILWIVLLLCI